MTEDLRYAFRLLRRNRGFVAGASVPLAFAIACTACALTLVDAVLFRPLGIREPGRLAAVYSFSRLKHAFASTDYADLRDIQSLTNIVQSAAAFVRIPVNVRLAAGTERMSAELITGSYFQTAGVSPALGRAISAEDHRPGAEPVTVVSHALWESRYRKSASVLGAIAWVDGVAFTIVGVMPREYRGTLLDWYGNPSFWIPLHHIRQMLPHFLTLDYENRRNMQWLMTIARLRPDVKVGQLQAAMDTIAKRITERNDPGFVALAASDARFFPGRRAATVRVLWLLVTVSVAALAIACFNLANLLLARAEVRRKEIGVRLALGAGKVRLTRQFLVENAALAACACALGLPLAAGMTRTVSAMESVFGLAIDLSPDGRALAASALAGFTTAVLASLGLAWSSPRTSLMGAIKEASGRPSGRLRVTIGDGFVAAQVACAMAAMVTAALLAQSLRGWQRVPLGYAPEGILIGELDSLSAKLTPGGREKAYRSLLAETRSEARGAALASQPLPARVPDRVDATAEGTGGRWTAIESTDVSDGYFELLGVPVVRGRSVLATDDGRNRAVVVLNRTAADLFWPGQDPIGRHLRIRGEAASREVVGVVADARYRPLGEAQAATPFAFFPLLERLPLVVTIHVRTPGDPASFGGALRRVVSRIAPEMPLSGVQPLEQLVGAGLSQVRLIFQAIGAVSAVSVILALAGVVATGAYRIAQRRREIAIRIAIGDEPGRLVRSFASRGAVIGIMGAAFGTPPAVWLATLLRSSLRGVDTPSLWLFALSGILLAAVSGVASWAVARRIAHLEPADVLRVQ